MASYKIVGARRVAGKQPGATLTDEDLAAVNIPALIAAGHIIPVRQQEETGTDTGADHG